ncbi:MAG: hypothetical protein K2X86_12980 [Cytophagaceae bacterium]|nr:hypothetical protein [Cytophagaceae bacterium]
MKKIWRAFTNWFKSIYKFIAPGKKRIEEDDDNLWDGEKVVMPEQYYITRTGQMMREPVKKRTFFKSRYRMGKRAY